MAYSLRLPDALDAAVRTRADYLGISLNALVCVALDAFLRAAADPAAARSDIPVAVVDSSKTKVDSESVKLTRAQKQVLYEQRKKMFRGQ